MSASFTSSGDMTCCSGSAIFCSAALVAGAFSPAAGISARSIQQKNAAQITLTVRFIGALLLVEFLHFDYVFHHDNA